MTNAVAAGQSATDMTGRTFRRPIGALRGIEREPGESLFSYLLRVDAQAPRPPRTPRPPWWATEPPELHRLDDDPGARKVWRAHHQDRD